MKCAKCPDKKCYLLGKDCTNQRDDFKSRYNDEDTRISEVATFLEGQYYMKLSRLQELILFAQKMDYKHLGIAFCIGFSNEAEVLHDILAQHFAVSSICCKCGSIPKDDFGYKKIDENRDESICNPIGQATILNNSSTELNIMLGLCIGHDILFSKHSTAPVTTFAVKDRILAHNPLGAIYSKYYVDRLMKGRVINLLEE